ncbi:ubiquitin-conjugating enzyme/RWD-like protein, partial [Russula ochroleuca]
PIKGSPYEPVDDNLFNWKCSIKGASDSPYKGGTFFFKVTFSEDFLMSTYIGDPSQVIFTTKIYHPGINDEGGI